MLPLGVMRRMDSLAGCALCAALDCLDLVSRPLRRLGGAKRRKAAGPVAVIKLWGLGSVILSQPALRAIRQVHPGKGIVYVTFAENAPMVEALETVDEIVAIRRGGIAVFAADTLRAVLRLRRLRARVVIDCEFLSRYTALLAYASGAPERVGFALPRIYRGKRLLTRSVFYSMYSHISSSWIELVRASGGEGDAARPEPSLPSVRVREEWRSSLEGKLGRIGIDPGGELVAVNVNAGEIGVDRRRWPAGHFAALVRELAGRRPGLRFVFTGSASESAYVEEIAASLRGAAAVSVAGMLSVGEMLALLERARLLVTNDSGPMHMAAAVGTKTVSLFGPESPVIYGPLGEGHAVLYLGLYCSPCHNMFNAKKYLCPWGNRCLTEIAPREVAEAADRCLSGGGDRDG